MEDLFDDSKSVALYDLQTEPERLSKVEKRPEDVENIPYEEYTHRWSSVDGNGPEVQQHEVSADKSVLLPPDHPLLVKFQQTLRTHLTQQIERLNNEVLELETSIKEEEKIKESLAVSLYEKQQDICRQQNKIETCERELQDLLATREVQEEELRTTRQIREEKQKTFQETDSQERKLRTEMESLTMLEKQLQKWKEEMDAELAINQRISDKSLQDKKLFAQEKRQLDMLIYKIMSDVWKCENEIQILDMQLHSQEKKREELMCATQDANANLEAINSQQKSLIKAWNDVLLALKKRDVQYQEAVNTVKKLTLELQLQQAEIESFKKKTEEEINESMRFAERKEQINMDYAQTMKQLKQEQEKLYHLTDMISTIQNSIEMSEKDIQSVKILNLSHEKESKQKLKEFEQQMQIKVELEDKIMKTLDECVVHDNASANLNRTLRDVKEKCRQLEYTMLSLENKDANLLVEIEHQKGINAANTDFLMNLQKIYNERNEAVNKLNLEMSNLEKLIPLRQQTIVATNRKLIQLMEKYETDGNLSPQDLKIRELEKNIDEKMEVIHQLDLQWMQHQNYLVSLTEQRNVQLNQINLLNKQMMIIHQKNLQLEDEIDKYRKRENEMAKNVERFQKHLAKLNSEIARNRSLNEKEDGQVNIIQAEYLAKLQACEQECVQLENDIAELEFEKQSLTKQLIEVNREGFTWQKQAQIATEARKTVEDDTGNNDINLMKIEIHRMQVRYGQLKKVQERMITDMEQCVSRRDNIILDSEVRIKRNKNGVSQLKLHFGRKINEMRSKIKQIKKEIEGGEKEIRELTVQETVYKQQQAANLEKLNELDKQCRQLEKKFYILELEKHQNLDKLVKKQRRARCFDEILKGTFKARPMNILDIEEMKQEELNRNITELVKQLMLDFPQHNLFLSKVIETLKTKVLEV